VRPGSPDSVPFDRTPRPRARVAVSTVPDQRTFITLAGQFFEQGEMVAARPTTLPL
jgi:hypothetical protein